jgi:hypothetical protein
MSSVTGYVPTPEKHPTETLGCRTPSRTRIRAGSSFYTPGDQQTQHQSTWEPSYEQLLPWNLIRVSHCLRHSLTKPCPILQSAVKPQSPLQGLTLTSDPSVRTLHV